MSAADCERWENRLLDLAYGEIEKGDEREVRAHLDGCEHCRRGLEKLTRGRSLARHLEQLEPPPEAMQAVLRAARDKALEIEAARAQAAQAKAEHEESAAARPAPPPPEATSWWGALLGVVMAPQFAMATLLLLTVGVGLWWFPGRGPSTGAPPLVSEPTTTLAAGPEALTPAEPLRFEVDPRTGRVEAHHEGEGEAVAEVAPTRPRGIHFPTEAPPETGESLAGAATVMLDDGESVGTVVDGVLPEPEAPRLELGMTAESSGLGASSAATSRPSIGWPSPSAGSAPATTGSVPPVAPAPATPMAEGRVAERAPMDEVESPTVDGSTLMAAALLRQARDLVRAGRDREAIAQYESLLTRYRSAAEAPTAMIEIADCYRRTGAISRARGWLERAAGYPSVAAAARRELLRLDAAPPAVDSEAATSDSY